MAVANMLTLPIIILYLTNVESKIVQNGNAQLKLKQSILSIKNDKDLERIKFDKLNDESENDLDISQYGLSFFPELLLYSFALKELKKNLRSMKEQKYTEMAGEIPPLGSMFQGCSNETCPSSSNIETFKINLDAKPEMRWKEVMQHKKKEVKRLADFFEYKFGKKLMGVIDKYIAWLHKSLPKEYLLELQGIAKETGLSTGRVTLYNVFYEFFSVCTSIIIEGEDGKMYHGRNLDFGLFMGWDSQNHTWYITEILRPLIVNVDFYKGKSKIYSATTYAGYTGILTGVKKGKFSLTIDERFTLNGGFVGIAEWILGRRDLSWLGHLTRQVFETANTYEEAQKVLATSGLVSPVYFILAGNNSGEGCIITRSRYEADIWTMGNKYPEQNEDWYTLETNFDHWKTTPFWDQRRHFGIQCMEQTGRRDPFNTLYSVLSTRPVFNKETTLTALMDVTEGVLKVWERNCEDPCWPF